jgi:hypothetical protein
MANATSIYSIISGMNDLSRKYVDSSSKSNWIATEFTYIILYHTRNRNPPVRNLSKRRVPRSNT